MRVERINAEFSPWRGVEIKLAELISIGCNFLLCGDDEVKQKFKKLSFVRVCKEMPSCMSHFESDFDAIVEGTYSQLYGGKNIKDYSLYQIENGEIVNATAWYEEGQLTLIDDTNRDKAEQMIEKYNFKDDDDDE